jgi:hypothetical protein
MSNQLSIIYYNLGQLFQKKEISYICNEFENMLNKKHLASIINAFYLNTRIASNGLVYLRIKGIAQVLRTGASGAERYLIYNGVDGVVPEAEIMAINGEEYISGPSLAALLDYRMSTVPGGKTKSYLKFSESIYRIIKNHHRVQDIRDIYLDDINKNRKYLKKERINTYNINKCEFSGVMFNSNSDVEFAHIESVVTNPFRALDINNGVIILKEIHAELTRRNIHNLEGMYNYCIENRYSTDWCQ